MGESLMPCVVARMRENPLRNLATLAMEEKETVSSGQQIDTHGTGQRCRGKRALVTGAASGIGAATSGLLAGEGARVVLADVDEAGAERVAGAIGEAASSTFLDVCRAESWSAAATRTIERLGGWDVLVNCAGILRRGSIETTTLAAWHQVLDVNLRGTWLGAREAVRHMQGGGGGVIVNLSSVSGIVGDQDLCAYNASKGGVRLLTKAIASHATRHGLGIRCNSVHPGVIETPMVANFIAESDDPVAERAVWDSYTPAGVTGYPDDVGHLVVFLVSDESRLVNGAELVIDGGGTVE